MFAKFNLDLKKNSETNAFIHSQNAYELYYDVGAKLFEGQKRIISENLEKYLGTNGVLKADEIENDWFPQIEADVFLSHSHQDVDVVTVLVGYMWKKYGIKCFVDSLVWEYADNLLKQIDNVYCKKTYRYSVNGVKYWRNVYNYNKRNQSTVHVHMLLQGALAKMINQTECMVFINTPNSLDVCELGRKTTTSSAWIYNELLMACTFPPRVPDRFMAKRVSVQDSVLLEETRKFLQMHFPLPIEQLVELDIDDFDTAKRKVCMQKRIWNISLVKYLPPAKLLLEQIYHDKKVFKKEIKVIVD